MQNKTGSSRLSAIAIVLLLGLMCTTGFSGQRPLTRRSQAHASAALPSARGPEAARVLQQENLYDSLASAYHGGPVSCGTGSAWVSPDGLARG